MFQRCGDIMKKRANITIIMILLLCCLIGILSCLFCKHKDCYLSNKSATETVKKSETINTEIILENEYNERITTAHSNFEKSETNYEYAKKWNDFSEKYYNKLLELANDNFKESLIASQEAWVSYAKISEETQLSYLQNVYEYGTIVSVLHSQYVYDLYHDRALELYEMYLALAKIQGDGSVIDG